MNAKNQNKEQQQQKTLEEKKNIYKSWLRNKQKTCCDCIGLCVKKDAN